MKRNSTYELGLKQVKMLLYLAHNGAHNRSRPCFSGNVFYSWPEMAKCFFIVFVIHILQNHTYDSM